jgi:hypothetical protein
MAEPIKDENKEPKKMGRPSTLSPEWQALVDKLGSVEKLCNKLGCAERTLRHWSSGSRRPTYPVQRVISDLCYELRLPEPLFLSAYERPRGGYAKPNTAAVRATEIAKMRQRREERRAKVEPEATKASE